MPGVPPDRAVARISPGAASPGCLQLLSRLNLAAPCSGCLPVSPLAGIGRLIPWAGLFPWDKDKDNIYSINIRQLQLAFFSDLRQFHIAGFPRVIPCSHGGSWEQTQPTENGIFLVAHIFP